MKRHTLEELVAYTQVPPLHEGQGSKPVNKRLRVSNDQSSETITPYLILQFGCFRHRLLRAIRMS